MSTRQFPISDGRTTFGLHLMLDAYQADPKKLNDMRIVYQYLNQLPAKIDMNKLSAPQVLDCAPTESGKDPGGVTGVVLIAESHISIHTFPENGFLTMDLYSCNDFQEDVEKILKFTKNTFNYKTHQLNVVPRGKHYPINDCTKKA